VRLSCQGTRTDSTGRIDYFTVCRVCESPRRLRIGYALRWRETTFNRIEELHGRVISVSRRCYAILCSSELLEGLEKEELDFSAFFRPNPIIDSETAAVERRSLRFFHGISWSIVEHPLAARSKVSPAESRPPTRCWHSIGETIRIFGK